MAALAPAREQTVPRVVTSDWLEHIGTNGDRNGTCVWAYWLT